MLLMFLFKPPLLNKAANYGENSNNVKQYYNLKHLFSMYFNVTYSWKMNFQHPLLQSSASHDHS